MTASTGQDLSTELLERPLETPPFAEAAAEADVEIIDYRPSLLEAVRDAWRHRRLLLVLSWGLAVRLIKKYRLGPTWLLLTTFMSVIGYSLIFGGGVFTVPTPNGMPYFLFLMVGMMGWQLFQHTLIFATRSFQRLKFAVRDLHVPLTLVPIAGSAPALLRFLLFIIGYIGVVIYYWLAKGEIYAQRSPKYLLMSIAGLGLCLALAWGIAMWTATLYVWARDVRMVIRFALPFWMFLTPVLYPIEHLHGKFRTLAELNPLSSPIEMAKVGLLGVGSVRVYAAIWSIATITVVFLSGVWFVSRYGHAIAGVRDFDEDEDELM